MNGGVDSVSHSVAEVPRSAPEPELETVDQLDHLHKIDHEVPSAGSSTQNSTWSQECWESAPGTWQQCRVW